MVGMWNHYGESDYLSERGHEELLIGSIKIWLDLNFLKFPSARCRIICLYISALFFRVILDWSSGHIIIIIIIYKSY